MTITTDHGVMHRKMIKKFSANKTWIIFIFGILLINFVSSIELYSGDAYIQSVDSEIYINGENAKVESVYNLIGDDTVLLNFVGIPTDAVIKIDGETYPKEFEINPSGLKEVKIEYNLKTSGKIQSITYEPKVLFDGKLNDKKVGLHSIEIITPNYLKDFIFTSEEYDSRILGNENKFVWRKTDEYLASLNLKWNNLGYNLFVNRTLSRTGESIHVNVSLMNLGEMEINNIILEESNLAKYFTGAIPENEFSFETQNTGSEIPEILINWKKEIPVLGIGENKNFEYIIKPNPDAEKIILNPLVVRADGVIITSTEPVLINVGGGQKDIKSSVEKISAYAVERENLINEDKEKSINSFFSKKLFIYFGILVFLVGVLLFFYFLRKRNIKITMKELNEKKLYDYILDGIKKGYSKEQLRKILLKAGVNGEEINEEMEKFK